VNFYFTSYYSPSSPFSPRSSLPVVNNFGFVSQHQQQQAKTWSNQQPNPANNQQDEFSTRSTTLYITWVDLHCATATWKVKGVVSISLCAQCHVFTNKSFLLPFALTCMAFCPHLTSILNHNKRCTFALCHCDLESERGREHLSLCSMPCIHKQVNPLTFVTCIAFYARHSQQFLPTHTYLIIPLRLCLRWLSCASPRAFVSKDKSASWTLCDLRFCAFVFQGWANSVEKIFWYSLLVDFYVRLESVHIYHNEHLQEWEWRYFKTIKRRWFEPFRWRLPLTLTKLLLQAFLSLPHTFCFLLY